jgi:ribosomal small subunit protein bTHX
MMTMGKGDKRTRRGKIFKKSFGKSRPKAVTKKPGKPDAAPAAP